MLACLVFNVLETAGTIVWATLKQQHVPAELLGRVSSLDWLISIGLLPLSFALTAPAVALLGARTTLVAAGVIGAAVTASALLLPGMLDLDRAAEPEPLAPDEVDVVVTRIHLHESDPSALPRPRA
jgi:DHA3 family tetracycline resistance protein-like MFS transporter